MDMDTTSTSDKSPYEMSISLSVLKHLGKGLYSNVPAVLSEIVANAWDADAENVHIDIDPDNGVIVITDDGHGMTQNDINTKYLTVGYQKREMEPNKGITPRFKRDPMGRKGIGKLSVFSIANIVEIYTVCGNESNALQMDADEIEKSIKSNLNEIYRPTPLDPTEEPIDKGTKIILKQLQKNITTAATYLRRRVARRFSVIGKSNQFVVHINGEEITPKDRDYYKYIEFRHGSNP
jgi:HSP90 family molecular chaperone